MREYDEKDNLSNALIETLEGSTIDILENCLDATIDEDILKEISLIRSVVSLCKFSNELYKQFYIRKLFNFIKRLNENIVDDEERKLHILQLKKDPKRANKELAYIAIAIERYLEQDKPDYLAKCYLAYLRKKISWNDLCMYSVLIDRLLLFDIQCLKKVYTKDLVTSKDIDESDEDSIIRIASLGILTMNMGFSNFEDVKYEYYVTSRAKKFAKIIFE